MIGAVRDTSRIADLADRYPETFIPEMLEMTDSAAVRHLVGAVTAWLELQVCRRLDEDGEATRR